MTPISYISDQPADYVKALVEADTLAKLLAFTKAWSEVAKDAHETVRAMTPHDFKEWRKGYAKERAGKFAGEKFAVKYGALMMPEVLMKVSMIAQHFGAPWGCAYLRLKQTGQLEQALQ